MRKKAVFAVSFDVEAGFGRKNINKDRKLRLLVSREPGIVDKILRTLDTYNMQATFAVVGKLFQQNQILVKRIARAGHEIGSHSLTHADFKKLSYAEAEFEIKEVVSIAKRHDFQLRSFVFPYNHISHLSLLAKYGFQVYRAPLPSFPFSNILSFLFPRGYSVSRSHKLVLTLGSFYFSSNRKLGKYIPKGWRFSQAKKGIDHAIKTGTVFHLWTHPIDLVDSKNQLFKEFEQILAYVSKLEQEQKIEIRTMQ